MTLTPAARLATPPSQPESAALLRLARAAGLRELGGAPLTEALIFGLGGGIGASLAGIDGPDGPSIHLGLRHAAANVGGVFTLGACERAGLQVELHRTPSPEEAENRLVDQLLAGAAVGLWADPGALPWRRKPWAGQGAFSTFLAATSFDEEMDEVHLEEACGEAMPFEARRLAAARVTNPALAHRTLRIVGVEAVDLRAATLSAIRAGTQAMLHPPLRNLGVEALRTWSAQLRDRSSPRGWARRHPGGAARFRALVQVFDAIETDGTGGGALRPLYGSFLDLCAGLWSGRGATAWRSAAQWARTLGAQWTALAETALPNTHELLSETRGLLRERDMVVRSSGFDAIEVVQRVNRRLDAIATEWAARKELGPRLDELASQVELLADQEEAFARSIA